MSIVARLLALLALLMLVLPAPLKASCCPDPAQASGQMPEAPPCHGDADDHQAPAGDHSGCEDGCCPCRAPVHVPDAMILSRATLPPPLPDLATPLLPVALRIPPLPPPIA
jgi:hypothetical protein